MGGLKRLAGREAATLVEQIEQVRCCDHITGTKTGTDLFSANELIATKTRNLLV